MSGERELGTLLAGLVDGAVDELAREILGSDWLAERDRRVRAEALREAANALCRCRGCFGGHNFDCPAPDLYDRADRIEADR